MSTELEERIRRRAYELWEREGFPHGKDEAHWHQAALEIEDEDRKAAGKPSPKGGKAGQSDAMKAAEAAAREHGFSLDEIAKAEKAKPAPKKRAASKTTTKPAESASDAPAKKKPGRPKKAASEGTAEAPAKRKPGRPKKSEI